MSFFARIGRLSGRRFFLIAALLLGSTPSLGSVFEICTQYWASHGYNTIATTRYCNGLNDLGLDCTVAFGDAGHTPSSMVRLCHNVHTLGAADCAVAAAGRYSPRSAVACAGVGDRKGSCMAALIRRGYSPRWASARCR